MLTIQSFQSNYLVSRDQPSPEKLRSRLDDIVLRRLPAALDGLLEEWERQKPGLWFIRDLEIELDINAAWDDDLVAGLWAKKILLQLAQRTPLEEPGLIYFPNAPAYLARFLVDLAAGRAWGVWYYRSFEGLRSLPVSMAIRTALEEDPVPGLSALARLKENELEDMLAALSETDARRLQSAYFMHLDAEFAAPPLQERFEACWQSWSRPNRPLGEHAEAIFHFVRTVRSAPGSSSAQADLILIIQALTRLSRLLPGLDEQGAGRLLSALAGGDLATLYASAGRADGEALQPLLRADPDWIWQVGRSIGRTGALIPPDADLQPEGQAGPVLRYTPFGGTFLLLPFLGMLPFAEIARDWPGLEALPADAVLRFLTLAAAFGNERSGRVFADPLLRDLFRIPPGLSAGQAAAWGKSIPARRWQELIRRLAGWQVETGLAQNSLLVLVPLKNSRRRLILDASHNLWRAVTIRGRAQDYLQPGERLYGEDPESPGAGSAGSPFSALGEAELPTGDVSLDEVRSRISQVQEDWDYLRQPGSTGFSRAIPLAAQNILRLFAGRLPGFSRSGPAYLFRNFLDFAASLEQGPDRWIARLGKPPLSLILGMAGQDRQSYNLEWLDGRPFELYQQD